MSERILMKFVVGQRVVKEGEDSRFEGEVVAAFVKRNLKTLRYVVENDDGVLHIASERQLRLAMPKAVREGGAGRQAQVGPRSQEARDGQVRRPQELRRARRGDGHAGEEAGEVPSQRTQALAARHRGGATSPRLRQRAGRGVQPEVNQLHAGKVVVRLKFCAACEARLPICSVTTS
jgi:hypothetical protein